MEIMGDLGAERSCVGTDKEEYVESLSRRKESIHMDKFCLALVKYAAKRSKVLVMASVLEQEAAIQDRLGMV